MSFQYLLKVMRPLMDDAKMINNLLDAEGPNGLGPAN